MLQLWEETFEVVSPITDLGLVKIVSVMACRVITFPVLVNNSMMYLSPGTKPKQIWYYFLDYLNIFLGYVPNMV